MNKKIYVILTTMLLILTIFSSVHVFGDDFEIIGAQETLLPNADIITEWAGDQAGWSNYEHVRLNDTTRVRANYDTQTDLYELDNPTLSETPESIRIGGMFKNLQNTESVKILVYDPLTSTWANSSLIGLSTSYAYYSYELLMAPNGNSWDLTTLENLQIGIWNDIAYVFCSYLEVVVTYMEPQIEIYTIDDLYKIRYNLSGNYILMNDLDFQNNDDYVDWSVSKAENTTGSGWFPIEIFSGNFDGQGYTINNLYINRPSTNDIGLFSTINGYAEIHNIILNNINIIGGANVGSLVGYMEEGIIINCGVESGIITSTLNYAGGLIGTSYYGSISSCFSLVDVIFNNSLNPTQGIAFGGLIGHLQWSSVKDCYATGAINTYSSAGGLIGEAYYGDYVNDSYATGEVTVTSSSSTAGGLVGVTNNFIYNNCYATGLIISGYKAGGFTADCDYDDFFNCYAIGDVEGVEYVGGFIGDLYSDYVPFDVKIINCYSNGNVTRSSGTSAYVGGFVGRNRYGIIHYCYSTGYVSCGTNTNKGFSGAVSTGAPYSEIGTFFDNETSNQLTTAGSAQPKNTQDMQTITTFSNAGWDIALYREYIDEAWYIENPSDYPRLGWEYEPESNKMHYPQYPDPNGWDVYSMADFEFITSTIADDWMCSESGLVTNITWWGSWYNDEIYENLIGFYIGIWSDVPATETNHSMPGALLWDEAFYLFEIDITPEIPSLQGWLAPDDPPYYEIDNHMQYFRYDLINITDPFYQENETIYWLSIAALVDYMDPGYQYEEWGWKTSLDHWNDEAVYGFDDRGNWIWFNMTDPITHEPLDLSFIIDGQPQDYGDPTEFPDHKMHFPQYPDSEGWDVAWWGDDILADDWMCNETGSVTDIHFWFSSYNDTFENLPELFIGVASDNNSKPGEMLWSLGLDYDIELSGPYYGDQGYYIFPDVFDENNHVMFWRVDITNISDPFIQQNGTIYWLTISFLTQDAFEIGWKTSLDHFEADAVYGVDNEGEMIWYYLSNYFGETISFSFVITGEPYEPIPETELAFNDENVTVGTPINISLLITPGGDINIVEINEITFSSNLINYTGFAWGDLFENATFRTDPVVDQIGGYINNSTWGSSINTSLPGYFFYLYFDTIDTGIAYVNITYDSIGIANGGQDMPKKITNNATIIIGEEETWNHKMHYPQLPDPFGIDVAWGEFEPMNPRYLADDWLCTETGTIDNITFWVSTFNDGELPPMPVAVEIWSDNRSDYFSKPGEMLWADAFEYGIGYNVFGPEFGLQSWMVPPVTFYPDDHTTYWRIDITNISNPFIQENGTMYWLVIWVPILDDDYVVGWKTSLDHFEDHAVWGHMGMEEFEWYPLNESAPNIEPFSLAFIIDGMPVPQQPTFYVGKDYNTGTPGWHVTHWDVIQDAIDNATAGYRIFVNGDGDIYNENLYIDMSIDVIANYTTSRPQIVGQHATKSTVEITTNWVNFSGFYIDNTIGKANSYHGIKIGDYNNNVTINDCYFVQVANGILLNRCDHCTIENSYFISSTIDYGIYVFSSSAKYNIIRNCNISNVNINGIYLYLGADNNNIYNNTIVGMNTYGIRLGTKNNYIFRNNISNNGHGIRVDSGQTGNTIYHNNFIGNTNHVSFVNTANQNYWNLDYPFCGNHWSGHGTQDIYIGPNQDIPGTDGICDSNSPHPKTVGGVNVDNYPFLNPFNGTLPPAWNEASVASDEDPMHTEINISVNYTQVSVNITDPEGDTFNVFIHSNYLTNVSLYDQVNGTFSANLNTPLPFEEVITWHVDIQSNSSTIVWNNYTFNFTTEKQYFEPDIISTIPENNSNYIFKYITLNANITGLDDKTTNISFYWANHTLIDNFTAYESGVFTSDYVGILDPITVYNWYIVVDDGTTIVNQSFSFTVRQPWDLTGSGICNYLDVSLLVSNYLQVVDPPGSEPWDINNDGPANYLDISILVSNYLASY